MTHLVDRTTRGDGRYVGHGGDGTYTALTITLTLTSDGALIPVDLLCR